MKHGRAIEIIGAALLSMLSCRSMKVPEPEHPEPQEEAELSLEGQVCLQKLPAAKAMEVAEDSLNRECASYCAYMAGDNALLHSSADPAFLERFGPEPYEWWKSWNYGPKIEGEVLFCDHFIEHLDSQDSSAEVLFVFGVNDNCGENYMLKRRVAFSFSYVSSENTDARQNTETPLPPAWHAIIFPVWGKPRIISEEKRPYTPVEHKKKKSDSLDGPSRPRVEPPFGKRRMRPGNSPFKGAQGPLTNKIPRRVRR